MERISPFAYYDRTVARAHPPPGQFPVLKDRTGFSDQVSKLMTGERRRGVWLQKRITSLPWLEMKQFITNVLTQFQRGEITLQEATDRLLAERAEDQSRKAKSDERLRELCSALEREQSPSKVRELKAKLSHEFYQGDVTSALTIS